MSDPASTANDPGRGPMDMALTWTFIALASVAVAARFLVRLKVAKRLDTDDWLMLLAAIFNLVFASVQTVAYHHGLGEHEEDYSPDEVLETLRYVLIGAPFGLIASSLARVSIAVFLVNMFGGYEVFRFLIAGLSTGIAISMVSKISGMFADQNPVGGDWRSAPSSRDWDQMLCVFLSHVGQSFSTFGDFVRISLPIVIVPRLNMPLRYRLDIILIASAALLNIVVSTLSIVGLLRIQYQYLGQQAANSLYDGSLVILYRGLEQSLVIIFGSIPSLCAIGKLEISRSFLSDLSSNDTKHGSSSESACDGSSDSHQSSTGDEVLWKKGAQSHFDKRGDCGHDPYQPDLARDRVV